MPSFVSVSERSRGAVVVGLGVTARVGERIGVGVELGVGVVVISLQGLKQLYYWEQKRYGFQLLILT
jgi:hypothetical protein